MKMKRILSITVALLLLMLALAACGGNSEEPAETESTEVTETTEEPAETTEESAEPAEEVEEAAETVAETSDLMALANQMIQEAGITDAIPVSAEALTNVYGLDPAQIVATAGYNAASGGAFPQEIVLVQASSADNAAAVAQAFTNRLSDIAAQAESYDPDSLALAQKCSVVTNGDYVGLFFSEHYDQFVDLFQNGLN